ncbi:MAG: recombinase family protein, partial [Myxococcota bacterium]
TLMFSQAEFYSATLSKRTQEAMRTRVADGWWVTSVPYGYRCVKKEGDKGNGRLVIHPQEAEIVRKVFALFCEGWGRIKILKKLNAELHALQNQADPPGLLSEDAVRLIRLRPLYTGVIYFGAKSRKLSPAEADMFENPEWRIVSDEVFQCAQNSLKPSSAERFRRRSEPCTLSGGFISCGYCGASCVRTASGLRCVKARNS